MASARATPYQVVIGGRAALQGVKHGRVTERVSWFLQEIEQPERARAVIIGRLNLPPGGAITLFALGRTIGWIGHALEAYETDRIIRPRTRYVGQLPPESEG